MSLLSTKALTAFYGDFQALYGIDAHVEEGETIAIVGANGAGKSTTMRMISGVLEPDAGDALVNDQSIVANRRLAQSQIGYLPEGAPLYRDMTPITFLRFMAPLWVEPAR